MRSLVHNILLVTIAVRCYSSLANSYIISVQPFQRPAWVGRPGPGRSSRSRRPNTFAFFNVSSSPGSRPRAGLRLPRLLPIRLGGTGAGKSSFKLIVIEEGSRERSCVGGGGGGARTGGDLLGGVGIFERQERQGRAEEDLLERKKRVGMALEGGDTAGLDGRRAALELVDVGIVEVGGGNGYSYGLDRSNRYGVPTKFVLSSSLELGSSFDDLGGIEIGTGMCFGRDFVLAITQGILSRYRRRSRRRRMVAEMSGLVTQMTEV